MNSKSRWRALPGARTGPTARSFRLALLVAIACGAPSSASAQGTVPAGFEDRLILGGLDYPVSMAFLPDGRAFVVEQFSTRVRLIVNGALAATDPVATLPDIQVGGEQGLLGIAVDPRWPASPYVYVHCDRLGTPSIRISRYLVAGDLSFTGNGSLTIDPTSRYDLINDLPDAASNHNGGTVRFGPDGMLYDSMGEDSQPCMAQDDSTLHGVILRLDVTRLPAGSGGPPALSLITPADNPQFTASSPRTRLIWAYGLRNPFRFQIDPLSGTLYIGDVGQNQYEEIDRAPTNSAPLDFGWPTFEGPASLTPTCPTRVPPTAPIHFYDRSSFPSGAAVICAGVYRAPGGALNAFPAGYDGDVFFSDYYQGFLRRLKNSGGVWNLAPAPGQPGASDWGQNFAEVSDYQIAPDGALWYCRQAVSGQPATGAIRAIATTAAPPGPAPIATLAPPYPSPSIGTAGLYYTLTAGARVDLVLYDERGREVRRIVSGEDQPAGSHPYTWDGRDSRGRAAPSGLYFVELRVGGAHLVHRLPFIR